MADYNLVVLVGRLIHDPRLRYTPDKGIPHCTLKLSVNRQAPRPDGSIRKSVAFVDVSVWHHQAEIACQFLKKGSHLLVSGWIEQRRRIDAAGKRISKLRVRAQRIQFMDRRPEASPTMMERSDVGGT